MQKPRNLIKLDTTSTPNLTQLNLGGLVIFYSYGTPVAFMQGTKLVVTENVFTRTTGKHINVLEPDHNARINNVEFIRQLNEAQIAVCKKIASVAS